MYRQGDVLIFRADVDVSSYEEVPRENGSVVLAHGEVTGHKHRLDDPGVCLLRKEGISDRVLTVMETSWLRHEEHDTIELPPGKFVVRIQKEYSETEMSRMVVD